MSSMRQDRKELPVVVDSDEALAAYLADRGLAVSARTLKRWRLEGKIPIRRFSAHKFVYVIEEIDRWLTGGPAGRDEEAA